MKRKTIYCAMILMIISTPMFTACSLYEETDTEIQKGPQTDNPIEPSPWDPQPGDDDQTETGH